MSPAPLALLPDAPALATLVQVTPRKFAGIRSETDAPKTILGPLFVTVIV